MHAISKRLLLGAAALLLGLVVESGQVHAGYVVCQTDPTVQLSNGVSVAMWAQITADSSQIQHVQYVLHVPRGVTVTGVKYDQYGALESVNVVADQFGSNYRTETTATTKVFAAVTAYARVSSTGETKIAQGMNGQDLQIGFWA